MRNEPSLESGALRVVGQLFISLGEKEKAFEQFENSLERLQIQMNKHSLNNYA